MHDEKYIVFKRETSIFKDEGSHIYATRDALDDAVVIRTQDVFAAAGLSAYAHNIRALCITARAQAKNLEIAMFRDDMEMIERLERIATYFEECAQEAEDRQTRGDVKVPD